MNRVLHTSDDPYKTYVCLVYKSAINNISPFSSTIRNLIRGALSNYPETFLSGPRCQKISQYECRK